MLKVLKNLKESFWSVVVIVILLCIQAATDLALPDYTSKIVNVGIQAGGIETAVPVIISKEDMDTLLIFAKEEDEILSNYTLVGDNPTEQEEKVIHKYLGKDEEISANTIYVLNEIGEEQEKELSQKMAGPLMGIVTLEQEETANQIKEKMTANMPEAQKQYIQSQSLIEMIKNMPEEQRIQILA